MGRYLHVLVVVTVALLAFGLGRLSAPSTQGDVQRSALRNESVRPEADLKPPVNAIVKDTHTAPPPDIDDGPDASNGPNSSKGADRTTDGNLKQGNRVHDGETVDYFPDGTVRSRGPMRGGLRVGSWTYFHEDGSEACNGTFVDGLHDGRWIYHDKDGRIQHVIYRNGLRHGAREGWYPDGQPEFVEEYVDDKLRGTVTRWHPNGALLERTTYGEFGRPTDGLRNVFHDNGVCAREETYAHGLLEGTYREFDERGNLTVQGAYLEGSKDGAWSVWRRARDGTTDVATEKWARGKLLKE